jgi:porphobilinogen synthase
MMFDLNSLAEGIALLQEILSRPRRNRRSDTFRKAIRETWLGPEHFILPIFVHDDGDKDVPISSMPGVYRRKYGKSVVDFVAEARSVGVNQVVIFPKVWCMLPVFCIDASKS